MRTRTHAALAIAGGLVTGCFGTLQPATASFQGVQQPVLLGPVDRIGGGPALSTRRVSSYAGSATALFARSESSTHVTETNAFDNLTMVKVAVAKLDPVGPGGDLRVTQVRVWAKGFISFIKNTVRIKGNVVAVGGG